MYSNIRYLNLIFYNSKLDFMCTVGGITNTLEGLGVTDKVEQSDILDVVRASSTLSLESLKLKEFTDLATDALNHLRVRQKKQRKRKLDGLMK